MFIVHQFNNGGLKGGLKVQSSYSPVTERIVLPLVSYFTPEKLKTDIIFMDLHETNYIHAREKSVITEGCEIAFLLSLY